LVGYTNAGKSTLLNALTGAGCAVADSLFTTLDTLSKSLVLPDGEHIVISDTVGFLHNLPHHLIEAFKATLEEVVDADLLIHVLDVNHPRVYERCQSVAGVLRELGAEEKRIITALNKIDLLDDKTWLEKLKNDFEDPIAISAAKQQNLDALLSRVQKHFEDRVVKAEVIIPNYRMDLVNVFYKEGKVEEIEYLQKTIKIKLILQKNIYHKLLSDKEIIINS
jgi:GTP-binding protein HflX